MRKAVIVGGSNGIGLSIAKQLLEQNYHVLVFDRVEPDYNALDNNSDELEFVRCNLLDFHLSLFNEAAADSEVDLLMITAGLGRVSNFQYIHPGEIKNLMTINTVSAMQIISKFYSRIRNKESKFYCGIMGSIAGLVSSPMFALYAASKAAICRFVESLNIELECSGTDNRILNVAPGSIKGTQFDGGTNNLEMTEALSKEILEHLFRSDTLFIPEYDSVYKNVLTRYNNDAHQFGLESYKYKQESGRAITESKEVIGYLSGTFDLFHIGHLNLLRRAKQQCDYLIVGVHNSGAWKGKETFIPLDERKAIIEACKYVDEVIDAPDEDDAAWDICHYNRLFVGSDYQGTERFRRYEEEFKDRDIKIIYFPYTKTTSSTELRNAIKRNTK